MSAIGRAALKSRESVELLAYRDSKGIWTIGVGHTAACGAPIPRAGMMISEAEADALLTRDLAKFEGPVAAALQVPVTDNEFDALVSLAFNVGAEDVARSTIVRRLNAGDRDGATQAFLMWRFPAEIVDRRKGEMDQFATPYAVLMPKARRSDKNRIAAPPGAGTTWAGATPPPNPKRPPAPAAGSPTPQPAPSAGFSLAALLSRLGFSSRS